MALTSHEYVSMSGGNICSSNYGLVYFQEVKTCSKCKAVVSWYLVTYQGKFVSTIPVCACQESYKLINYGLNNGCKYKLLKQEETKQ